YISAPTRFLVAVGSELPLVETALTLLTNGVAVITPLILDLNNTRLGVHSTGTRFMVFMFEAVNARFGGYQTIDIQQLTSATLVIYCLLMSVKPQMLCAINETPFELEWILLQTQQKLQDKVISHSNEQRPHLEIFLPVDRMRHYLMRQGSLTRARAKNYFAISLKKAFIKKQIHEAPMDDLSVTKRRHHRRFSLISDGIVEYNQLSETSDRISLLRMKLLCILFAKNMVIGLFSLITSTRAWLFIFVYFICAFESYHMYPLDINITVFRIIFEVTSAFGGCGLSMAYPGISTSFATVLSTGSRIILIATMCMGRHRGLLDSMKDQEEIEYSASVLLESWKQIAILEEQEKDIRKEQRREELLNISVTLPISPLMTRF
ncbi:unnamed protein product, partial [Didymodactylos carnosus]